MGKGAPSARAFPPHFGHQTLPPLANPPFGLKRCIEGL
jgi:hypothetical protein